MTTQEVRTEWVKRLRSGKYKQGQQTLHKQTGEYCCLGVLCEIAEENGICKKELNEGRYAYDGMAGYLPVCVSRFAGLTSEYGRWNESGGSLVKMNDQENKTFSEIADVIENPPEGLFVPDAVTA